MKNAFTLLALFAFVATSANAQSIVLSENFTTATVNAAYNTDTVTLNSGVRYVQCKVIAESNCTSTTAGLTLKKFASSTQGTVLLPKLSNCGSLTIYARSRSTSTARVMQLQKLDATGQWVTVASNSFTTCAAWSPSEAYTSEAVLYRLICSATDGDMSLYYLETTSSGGARATKDILYFSLLGSEASIATLTDTTGTVSLTVPYGSTISNVVPDSIGLSAFASISPSAQTTRDFSQPISYTVTAENLSTKIYTVSTTVAAISAENQILSFQINGKSGAIDHTASTISIKVASGTDLTKIVPELSVSMAATISPKSGDTVNFTNPVNYTVTAQNGSVKTYIVTVTVQNKPDNIDFSKPVGFASITADNFTGPTTGGGTLSTSTNIVTIKGPGEFPKLVTLLYDRIKAYKNKADYLTAKYAPLIIILKEDVYPETSTVANTGSVWGNSMLSIQDQGDITIIGYGQPTLNFGINVKRSYNVILRNLCFQDYYDDGVNIGESGTHHVWVDHCIFGHPTTLPADSEHPDGGCDIKDGASYVTVSWSIFRNSWKTGLVGHSDSNAAADSGRLKTTFYANYYTGSNSRHPRVRFGEVHVLNCYYENVKTYGIAAANSAHVVAEGNFFKNTRFPMYADRSTSEFATVFGPLESYTGNYPATTLKQFSNAYDDSGLPVLTSAFVSLSALNDGNRSIRFDSYHPELAFDPTTYYSYTTMDASTLADIVPTYAGADAVDFFGGYTMGLTKNATPQSVFLTPNPVSRNGSLTVGQTGKLTIYDLTGKILLQKNITNARTSIDLAPAKLSPGCCLVTLIKENQTQTMKLMVCP
jgi:pectate lyase